MVVLAVGIIKKKQSLIVLTKPFSLDGDSDLEPTYRAPNLLRRLLSLLKHVRPGSDLTHFQVTNFPLSLIQFPYLILMGFSYHNSEFPNLCKNLIAFYF